VLETVSKGGPPFSLSVYLIFVTGPDFNFVCSILIGSFTVAASKGQSFVVASVKERWV
jgi:hypothetical protein